MGKNLNSGKAREVAIGKQEADVCTLRDRLYTVTPIQMQKAKLKQRIIRYICMQKKENGDIRGSVNNNNMWGEK